MIVCHCAWPVILIAIAAENHQCAATTATTATAAATTATTAATTATAAATATTATDNCGYKAIWIK